MQRRPIALLVVVISIVVLSVTPLGSLGFKVVGALPTGLPAFHFPGLRVVDVDRVLPLAFACMLLAYFGRRISVADVIDEFQGKAATGGQALS